ncbi:MAG: response regulator [Candidatus Marinimicrobia bacterium]|nr:response regulator [Candidatus Neomarinimicrobiota bacterium]
MRSIDLFRASKKKPSKPESNTSPKDEKRVILTVIGSSQVSSAIEQSLESIFIELVLVGSGEAAVEYLNKNAVSLVISEINLPLMNGLNLSRKIKEDEALRDVPVLLISDSDEGPDKVMGMETGADDYVTLPINPSELRSRVMALISRSDVSQTGTKPPAVEKEIFEDGILSSAQGAGVDTIPEDEIGLGEPVEISSDVSDSTKGIVEEESGSPHEAAAEPVEEEVSSPSESEITSVEEMLNPKSPSEPSSPNPLRPEAIQSSIEVEDATKIIPQDEILTGESSDNSVQVEEPDQVVDSKPDLDQQKDNAGMLDDIFGGSSSTESLPSVDETESKQEQIEHNILPTSTPIVNSESVAPLEQPPPVPPIEVVVTPVSPSPAPTPTADSAAEPPTQPVQIDESVQQPPVNPTAAPISSQETTMAPADIVQTTLPVETPVEPATVAEETLQSQEPIASDGVEQFNEYEIDTAVDHKEIHQSTLSHLIELESAIIQGGDYNFTDIINDASKIVASVRNSNYLQIRAISKRDGGDFPVHSINVTIYSVKLATGLKYETKNLVELAVASLLHDIGMLLIPEDIRKAQRRLSPEEISTLKLHPQHGSEYLTKAVQTHPELAAFPFIPIVAFQEHERMNGTGYPNSIPGDEIHEYAKIISIIDMYEAVSHPSNYRDEYLAYEALQKVVALKDTHFDVKLLRALVREISIFPIDSVVRLNDGQIGKVIGLEPSHPMRPKLLLLYDTDGKRYEEENELELSKSPFLYVAVPVSEEDMEKLGN